MSSKGSKLPYKYVTFDAKYAKYIYDILRCHKCKKKISKICVFGIFGEISVLQNGTRGVYAVKNIIDHEKSDIKLDLSTIKFRIIPSVWSPEQFQNLVFFQKLAVQNAPSGSLGNHMQVLLLGFWEIFSINKVEAGYKPHFAWFYAY